MFYSSFRILGGFLLLTIGLLGLITPVLPGWPLLVVGLAMLARHFQWARRWLHRVERLRGRVLGSLRRLRRKGQRVVPISGAGAPPAGASSAEDAPPDDLRRAA